MAGFRDFTTADAVAAAEAALSCSAGSPVTLEVAQRLGDAERRNLVLRARACSAGAAARPVIIKATRAPEWRAGESSGFLREWAAATYLTRHAAGQGFAAALLGHDLAQGVSIFADQGEDLPTLVAPLLHVTAKQAEQALIAYARALGALHASTTGCRDGHRAILREAIPARPDPAPSQGWMGEAVQVASLLGGEIPQRDAEQVQARLRDPGPWQVLVHGDPCPDNVLLAQPDRAILIDFEFAGPGHALWDAAYWRMGFPTCWCAGSVPPAVGCLVDAAWRAAFAEAVPEAADDAAFLRESAIIDAAWLISQLAWLLEGALAQDQIWGRAANRSRILTYLDRAIASAEAAQILPDLRACAAAWRDDLQHRWPDATPLPSFPAFGQSAAA